MMPASPVNTANTAPDIDAWRSLSAADLARAYSPSTCIGGNYQPFVQAYAQRSAQAQATLPHQTQHYGPGAAQRLDLFLPPVVAGAALPPLLVFIHGGYWQELGKDQSAFAAPYCLRQGIAHAVLDYTLAPQATLAQIVAECRLALRWLHGRAAALGFDAAQIVVAGSSAGAHLAAMVALPAPGDDSAAATVRATVLVSGIFDLEPLVGTPINQALGLSVAQARALSPLRQPLAGCAPALVCWGEVETDEFKRQGRAFAAALAAAGVACQAFEVAERNHFDIVLDLADPGTGLGRAVVGLLRSEGFSA